MSSSPPNDAGPLSLALLSVIIPAQNEQESIGKTLEHLYAVLQNSGVPHEIIVVDDGSTDATWTELEKQVGKISTLRPVRNDSERGFGRAVAKGIDVSRGDAAVIMMADESDDCADVVRYWSLLNEGWECVFGSRFGQGGNALDYPAFKLAVNRVVNTMIRLLFRIRLNDTTNAFKAYRKTVLNGCRPFLSPHFNLTVELPLKAIVRGYSWTVIPTTWRNRESGASKLKLKEMGSRYLFIIAYVWLEKYFSRGDYKRADKHTAKGIERL
jgi:dolichol-phosphate mannosyltransferase